jgi:aerobic-type carbon monoxide dehydrogenase small subunit (CoxS/CutS family)
MKTIKVSFRVNDEDVTFQVKPYETLLETLRERLDLIGAKEACGLGACGACTVIVDGIKRMGTCIPFRRPLWRKGRFSAASARPG